MTRELHLYKENFLKYLEEIRGYSSLTIRSYEDALNEMLKFCEIEEEGGILCLNLMPFRLNIAHSKPKTIAAKLSATRSFAKYLRENGMDVELKGDESVKIPKTLPKPITHEQIIHALEGAEADVALAITLLYTMGLRISELAALRTCDIENGWSRIYGKGSKERDIPMMEKIDTMVRDYHRTNPTREYIFEKKGEKLSENSLRYMITKAFAKVGLKVTPHQLRHTYATELLNNGARIADVSELLGHSSMATTQIYTKLGNALKMENYLQAHPLCQICEDSE
jgi:integrase/recombinase XerC